MNDYRIIYKYKDREKTKVICANDVDDAKNIFFSKIKETAKQDIKIKDVRAVEPVTHDFIFDKETAATFLQWYLAQADGGEYELNCTMEGKTADENAIKELNAMQDFVNNNYLTNIKIAITGDRK